MVTFSGPNDIRDIARGAALLGTGGGGDPYVGELFLQAQFSKGRRPNVIPINAVPDAALVITVAGIGSPQVLLEYLASESTLIEILRLSEQLYGRPVDALISCEIGGVNSTFPLALSAISGIPVLDGDGVGRAVPRTEMSTFSIFGCPATPGFILDEAGNYVSMNTADDLTAEAVIRATVTALGGSVFGAFYPMSGAQVKRFAVYGTVTTSQEIGRKIRVSREQSKDIFHELLEYLNRPAERYAALLFDGKIVDVTHETRGGWHWGRATMRSIGAAEDVFTVDFQNEFTVARLNGRTVTIVPDLITILDRESGEPITGERLAYGQRVKVIGYSADPLLRTPEGLKVIGPANFGIPDKFVPVEELMG